MYKIAGELYMVTHQSSLLLCCISSPGTRLCRGLQARRWGALVPQKIVDCSRDTRLWSLLGVQELMAAVEHLMHRTQNVLLLFHKLAPALVRCEALHTILYALLPQAVPTLAQYSFIPGGHPCVTIPQQPPFNMQDHPQQTRLGSTDAFPLQGSSYQAAGV
jgi:hypothetical protein